MKKLLALMLLLCLCCTCAMSEGSLEIIETRVVRRVEEDYAQMKAFLKVTNAGDAPVSLNEGTVRYTDAQGALVDESFTYSMFPTVLQPGEAGYMYIWSYGIEVDAAKSIADYDIVLQPEHSYLPGITPIDYTAEYVVNDYEYYKEYNVIVTVTNNSENVVWEPQILVVVRAQNGKILDMTDTTMYGVGIPAGSSVHYVVSLSEYDVDNWTAAGYEVAEIETIIYEETK